MTSLAGKATVEQRADDLYETRAVAVCTLLLTSRKPACGPRSAVRILRAAVDIVHATGLVNYNLRDQAYARRESLKNAAHPLGVQAILSNPRCDPDKPVYVCRRPSTDAS
jgi:hypothetical protein